MCNKDKNIKTTCDQIKVERIAPLPAKKLAELTGLSESYVKKVRTNVRNDKSEAARLIKDVDELYDGGTEVLIEEIKKAKGL